MDTRGTLARIALGLAAVAGSSACASDPESSAGTDSTKPIEGLYAVRLHEISAPDCDADPIPVAEADLDDGTRSPPYLIVGPEPGPLGSVQLVALACERDMTCDVDDEFRLYYDLSGGWAYVGKRGSLTDDGDGCEMEARVEDLNVKGGGSEIEMLTRITADTVELTPGDDTCTSPVRDTDPEDMPCIRWERVVAERIEEAEPYDAGTEDASTDAETAVDAAE